MSTTDVPYLKLFRGDKYQPRWEPGPKLRAAGFSGRDLKNHNGTWLQPDDARVAATALNQEANAAIAANRHAPSEPRKHPRRIEVLYDAYKTSPYWQKLKPATRTDYTTKARLILDRFGQVPVAALDKGLLHTWWEQLHAAHGHATANGTIAVLRRLLSYACLKNWITTNPASQLGMIQVPPRVVVWLPEECEAFVAAADQLGHHGIGDAFVLALHTSQRLSDVLALAERSTADGRARFQQLKTGARVTVPLTDQLADRLAEARRRRNTGAVVEISPSRPIVARPDGRHYDDRFAFNVDFRAVRDAVADRLEAQARATPRSGTVEIRTKEFRDLRDTAITRLAEAECTIPEIAAISGHSLQTIHQIAKHYLALSESMAIRGIDKYKAWLVKEGLAL